MGLLIAIFAFVLFLNLLITGVAFYYWNHYRLLSEELESDLLEAEERYSSLNKKFLYNRKLHIEQVTYLSKSSE